MATGGNKSPQFDFAKKSTDFFQKVESLRFFEDFENLSIKPSSFHGEFYPGRIHELFKFCEKNSEYHILSYRNCVYYNCYLSKASFYFLAKGDNDPRLAYDSGPITFADLLRIAEFYKDQ